MTSDAIRAAEIRRFVQSTYGLSGTLRLHRAALGLDILRAPVNVALAPLFLLTKLLALLLILVRLRRAGRWLARRNLLLQTSVARAVAARLHALLERLDAAGAGVAAGPEQRARAVADYVAVRNAVSEITTSLIVLVLGYLILNAATPGVVSLAPSVAERMGHSAAIEQFWAGERLGRAWYATFPATIPPHRVILTGVVLAMIASVVTTFAGIVADPVQRLIGSHRRRLHALLRRLDRGTEAGLAPEHLAARTGDIGDALFALLRWLRG